MAAESGTLPPDVPSCICLHLCCSYWAADCVMPLGDMFWILAVQVGYAAAWMCEDVPPLVMGADVLLSQQIA